MQWQTTDELIDYPEAIHVMEQRASDIRNHAADDLIWLVEHSPLYTSGTSAKSSDLLDGTRFPVYETGRGGEYTYHGPGQRVAYVMIDLERYRKDLKWYVKLLEQWVINTLAEVGIEGFTRKGRVGVWVDLSSTVCRSGAERSNGSAAAAGSWQSNQSLDGAQQRDSALSSASSRRSVERSGRQAKEAKIAAIGIRVRKWVTFHGIAININPDLSHYQGIVPCGIREFGVTSLHDLGVDISMSELDTILKTQWGKTLERHGST